MSAELNMINAELKKIFSIETEMAADDILVYVDAESRQTLYNDTLKFFENLYGEAIAAVEETYAEGEYSEETYSEEAYSEETYSEEAPAEETY